MTKENYGRGGEARTPSTGLETGALPIELRPYWYERIGGMDGTRTRDPLRDRRVF